MKFLIIFLSILILGFSIFLAINPKEQTLAKNDERLSDEAKGFLEATKAYMTEVKSKPWEGNPSQRALNQMKDVLQKLQEKTKTGISFASEEDLTKLFLTQSEDGETSVCFVPSSKVFKFRAQDEGRNTGGKRFCDKECAWCQVSKL